MRINEGKAIFRSVSDEWQKKKSEYAVITLRANTPLTDRAKRPDRKR